MSCDKFDLGNVYNWGNEFSSFVDRWKAMYLDFVTADQEAIHTECYDKKQVKTVYQHNPLFWKECRGKIIKYMTELIHEYENPGTNHKTTDYLFDEDE